MIIMIDKKGRWDRYLFFDQENEIIKIFNFLQSKQVLFIFGKGFDPRLINILNLLEKTSLCKTAHALIITYDPNDSSIPSVDKNISKITKIFKNRIETISLSTSQLDYNSEIVITEIANSSQDFKRVLQKYEHVILDITAFPRAIFSILTTTFLRMSSGNITRFNFHIMVSENSEIDSQIQTIPTSHSPDFLRSLNAEITRSDLNNRKYNIVWLPFLEYDKSQHIKSLIEFLEPVHTVPVLPFPSMDVKKSDNLIIEYNDHFFASTHSSRESILTTTNITKILYVNERNPFQVYRKIRNLCFAYQKTFNPLDQETKIVLSNMSSKLVTLGSLLAANDSIDVTTQKNTIAMTYFTDLQYRPETNLEKSNLIPESKTYLLWITGSPYEIDNVYPE